MKITIIGTGGVGGYFGVRLVEVGHDVTFVARGNHLEKIKKEGLHLKSIEGNYKVFPAKATEAIHKIKDQDVILITVKSWQIEEVAKQIKSILTNDTVVLPLQNGVDNVERLAAIIDKKHLLAGFCKLYSKVEDYGIINHFAYSPELFLGEIDNQKSERVFRIKKAFDKATFTTHIPEDIHTEIWKKFIFICTLSGLGGLTRVSIGAMFKNKETRKLLQKTAEEIYTIANAKKIKLPNDIVAVTMQYIEKQAYDSTASTQRDIMEGRPSELENFNGYIVKKGKQLGIKTPVNSFIYHCLLPQEQQVRNK